MLDRLIVIDAHQSKALLKIPKTIQKNMQVEAEEIRKKKGKKQQDGSFPRLIFLLILFFQASPALGCY